MGLTGLEIYKLLPKKNCRECNFPTCMAFAMALAGGKASLEDCPYASEEARSALAEASEPPIRLVTIGTGEKALEVGGELVLFRHEKTFFHPTGVAIEVPDHLPDEELKGRAEAIRGLSFERVGLPLRVDLVALRHTAAEPQRLAAASRLVQEAAGLPLVLRTDDPAAAREALAVCGGERPLLWGAEQGNLEAMLELARQAQCPLVVSAGSLEELAELSQRAAAAGHRDLVLHPQAAGEGDLLAALTAIRRAALKKRFRPFGYPVLLEVREEDPYQAAALAGMGIAKYASVVVLDRTEPEVLLPLLTLRQDIYTDPQKPIQVRPECYPVGEPDAEAPVLVTTNFSLTYFSVLNELEASKVPSYLVTVDTDGTSVLTAWASGKFGPEQITAALEQTGVAGKVRHRTLIIPGYVAVISGRLAEMSGWEVMVGPREASGLPAFLRTRWSGRGGTNREARAGAVSAG